MSTNQAFLKAFRHDLPPAGPPAPVRKSPATIRQTAVHEIAAPAAKTRQAATVAPWQSTVEIVGADGWPETTVVATPTEATIGKRPLSFFTSEKVAVVEPPLEPAFTPETTISAFQWPKVCRALWEQFAEQYEYVAELLLSRGRREPNRGSVIGIAGLHAGDGCTTNLLCLAVALAARRTSAILVDGNFRAPRLAGLLGARPATTWQDVLEQGLPVAEAVIRAQNDHIDLLPLEIREPAGSEPNGAKLAASLQTSITAGVLRYAYDMVLVDLGAILAPRSFNTINHLIRNMRIDSALAVADPKHAEHDDLSVAGELLDECGCELLGTIENRTTLARKETK